MLTPVSPAVFDVVDFTKTTPAGILAEAPELDLSDLETAPAGGGDVLAALDEFVVVGTTGGFLGSDDFVEFVDDAEAGRVQKGWFEGKGAFAIIAIVLFGGLALNLTPCVLPMIPINLGIIGAGAQGGSRAQGFLLGGVYGLAMALVYGALGLVVILTAGTFGTINASPWFNIAMAVLFVVLALAMFDIITIDFSSLQSKVVFSEKGGKFLVAFGMGAVAALLAGACVAPVVIQVVVFSSDMYSKGQVMALALPFLLGIGMAIPWPIAGAGISLLPRPGTWMVRVKQAFGVLILGFAAYYGYLGYELVSQRFVDATEVADSVQEKIDEGWVASLDAGLAQAKAENKMVLVDVWATWCKNCLTMDKTTFKDPAVMARLDDYVKVKYRAEDPQASPAREVIKRFDGIGLPVYAILKPR
jgi:thiol:disulfide interchange protein